MLLQLIHFGIGSGEELRWAGLTYGWFPGLGCMRSVDGELPLHTIGISGDIGDYVCMVGCLHTWMELWFPHVPCIYGATLSGTSGRTSVQLPGFKAIQTGQTGRVSTSAMHAYLPTRSKSILFSLY
jgi:hypothetical protein